MINKTFYYVRVSSKEQNPQRQLDYLKEINLNIDERDIYIDKETGKNFSREQYQLLKKILRKGDILYVKSIDRFGRNYSEILNEWQYLTKKIGIDIVILDMPLLDTRKNKDILGNLISDLVLQLLSYVADTEYKNIKTRQLEGIASAKSRGIKFGRPKQNIDFNSDFKELYYQWKTEKLPPNFSKKLLDLKTIHFTDV